MVSKFKVARRVIGITIICLLVLLAFYQGFMINIHAAEYGTDALNETKDFKNSLWSYVNILDTKSKTFLYGTSS